MEGGNVTVVQGTAAARRRGVAGRRRGCGARRRPAARASTRPTSARATPRPAPSSRPNCKKAEARQAELLKEYNNGEPEKQGSRKPQLPEVPRPRGRDEGQHRPQRERHRRHPRARLGRLPPPVDRVIADGLRQGRSLPTQALPVLRPAGHAGGRGAAPTARCCSPTPRSKTRSAPRAARIEGSQFGACFTEPHVLRTALDGARSNEFAALRYDALLRRVNHEPMPVHVIAGADREARRNRRRAAAAGAAGAAGPRGAPDRPGAGQQGTDPQPGARDQEPAGRHPRRGAAAARWRSSRAS